jgi:predicted Zn-dependent peptidase
LELLNETLWPNHPLGRSLTGTIQTLDRMTRAELLDFQRSNYVSGGTLIAAAGKLKHEKILKAISSLAQRLPAGERPRFTPAHSDQNAPRLRLFTKPIQQTQVALGVRACSRHDERRFALRLLSTILGENMSSRLFQVLREDYGLAYSVCSSLSFYDDVGALVISAGLETDNLRRALKLITTELGRLRTTLVTPAELRRARDYLIGQIDLSLESTENQMMWLAEQMLGYGKTVPPQHIKRRLSAVTSAEIRAVARDFLRPEHMSLSLVSPLKSPRGLIQLLGSGERRARS